jgi:HAMP domain-containing protein
MSRFWAKSLAAQIIWFMLPLMLLAQSIGFLVTADERATELRQIALDEFVVRSATAAQLVDATPHPYRDVLLNAMGTNYSRFWLSTAGPGNLDAWSTDAWHRLHLPLRQGTPANPDAASGPWGSSDGNNEWGTTKSPVLQSTNRIKDARWQPIELDSSERSTHAQIVYLDDNYGAGLVARLSNGLWLNAAYAKPPKKFIWTSPTTVSLAITAIMLSALAVVVARRIARPMRRLTSAVESLGRGEQLGRIPEEGPDDTRRTAVAFNQMQERLRRFLADRTTMLAAIGHDLRTPITTMRLRAEFIADAETRSRLLDTVNEMCRQRCHRANQLSRVPGHASRRHAAGGNRDRAVWRLLGRRRRACDECCRTGRAQRHLCCDRPTNSRPAGQEPPPLLALETALVVPAGMSAWPALSARSPRQAPERPL